MNTERCIRSGEWSIHLEHFQYMLEIDRCRSISAAARSLGLVQTTLSSIVKNVESALGFPIFQRTPNGVAPTVFGEQFLTLGGEIHVRFEELLRLKSGFRKHRSNPYLRARINQSAPLAQRFYQFFHHTWSLRNAPGLKSSANTPEANKY
ncbi:MAG: LysR family transcriptional regulator [Anaerotruncus colihominis]